MNDSCKVEELRKINLEINQIVNQRFLISTTAISIFGVILALLIPKDAVGNKDLIFSGCVLLYFILTILYLYNFYLKRYLRILTSYLIVKYSSEWETHWTSYRKKYKVLAYSHIQTALFVTLGILLLGFASILEYSFPFTFTKLQWTLLLVVFGIYTILLILLLIIPKVCIDEEKSQSKWNVLINPDEQVTGQDTN